MAATLTNNQIRYAGKKILLYRPLPAMDAFHRSQAKNRWLFGGNRSGKPIHHEQLVLMADGTRKTMADLRVGDHVLAYDLSTGRASPTRVLRKFDNGVVDCYEVRFSDGGSVRAAGTHPFPVRHRSGKTYTTHGVLRKVKLVQRSILDLIPRLDNSVSKRPRMVSPAVVDYQGKERLPIDPYSLGCLLGDGCFGVKGLKITSPNPDVVGRAVRGLGQLIGGVSQYTKNGTHCLDYGLNGSRRLRQALSDMNLAQTKAGTKFVPLPYMRASVEDRERLLAGLVDTDGGANEFTSKSRQLASDFATLVKSLGGKATVKPSRKQCCNTGTWGDYWRVYWRLERRLPLCLAYKQPPASKRAVDYTNRIIRAIEPIGKCQTYCIEVAHQDHCFLLDDFVVTANSESNIGFDLCSFALGIHPHRVTPKDATVWAAANTWDLVGKLLWSEKIRAYLPMTQIESIIWHWKGADIPKELRLRNGNRIEFKAYEQGRKVFEGRAIDALYGDEQCKSDSEGIWQEIQARLLDKNGFTAQSMTPILFQAWLQDRIRALPETDAVFYADLNQNRKSAGGYVDDREIDAMIAEWPEEVQETRIKGHFAAFLGSVYKLFNRDTHVVKPFEIPPEWPRWCSIDWGFNNPFCCLWLARDPDRRWYVYAEHYQAQETLAYHAERIKQISGRQRYRATWADHDAQDRYEFEKLGIKTTPAKKDIHLGIEAVQTALKVQGDGKPRLFIFETCKNTIREMTGYKWAEGTETQDAKDEPLKVNDHAADALRYAIFGVEGSFYFSDSDLT